uniref:MHC class II beta chain N-terminal domain-containing protein n=1 Tax=Laticauda laticaudata TaxID=8630 RepID=A0A8C5T2I2_LATLA
MAFFFLLLVLATHFLYQLKDECHFYNGTQQVQLLFRDIYDQQEFVCFDSDLGEFVAITELGEVDVDAWNKDKQYLQYQKGPLSQIQVLGH